MKEQLMDQKYKTSLIFHHRCGFTLIELMISIALVVILILGVSQVFQYTTQAVGAGEAITAAIRNGRSAQTAFDTDFGSMVGYGPGVNDSACLVLSSRAAYAFRDAKDQASQGKLDPTATALPAAAYRDLDGNGISGEANVNGEVILPDNYNYRNHRLDTLSFFARNQFARQTGNPGTLVANESSSEAWIWYGHLWLPDNNLNFSAATFPTAGNNSTNPNNYFGSKLTLGRMAVLLTEKSAANIIYDLSGNPQWFADRSANIPPDLTPLSYGSQFNTANGPAAVTTDPGDPGSKPYLYSSRLDLASTSISNFRQKLLTYIAPPWNANNPATWWWPLLSDGTVSRFQCNPFLTKPMTAKNMAQASPYFLGGCSQFIVEFAGDFLTQDNNPAHTTRIPGTQSKYGDVIGSPIAAANPTNVLSDGQLDFFVNSNNVKQTIWYGMPRNTSGLSTTCASNGDVVPVRDWLQNIYDALGNPQTPVETHAPFEAYGLTAPYYIPTYRPTDYNAYMTRVEAQQGYTCAWGPNDKHPKIMLIRITMTLEDPTGRLPDGQTFQYVFPVTPTPTSN